MADCKSACLVKGDWSVNIVILLSPVGLSIVLFVYSNDVYVSVPDC